MRPLPLSRPLARITVLALATGVAVALGASCTRPYAPAADATERRTGAEADAAAAAAGAMSPAHALSLVDAAARRGIAEGIYPGAVLVVGTGAGPLYARGYGHYTWDTTSATPSPDSTLWDLASVTKVVGTASAAARLVAEGKLDLDAPVARYLPEFRGPGKERVTVRMLLDHTSGLPDFEKIWKKTRRKDRAIRYLLAEPLERAPGASAVYSDFNAMILGLVLERAAGQPLEQVVASRVLEPLGMRETRYNPSAALRSRIAPTGIFRGVPSSGMVHDKNATILGGVSGHAGLFASGGDVARLAAAWLREGRREDGSAWLAPAIVDTFIAERPGAGSRRLGWDGRDGTATPADPSVFGSATSPRVYGHTGWTGTMLWVDPARDLYVVFLTNRTFDPRAQDPKRALRRVRAELADAVVRWREAGGRTVEVAGR
ncbi:MAG TPA: serine hydrolase domain-containing protein [Gemmatimonadales bacterium]|nr:serine hydrolase domain-containing protein [Gemmatimonadales bacterium]